MQDNRKLTAKFQPITAKIQPPSVQENVVDRSRLHIKWRDDSANVIVIWAPAGAGKTTLAMQLCSSWNAKDIAWYSVDKNENQPFLFANYLIAALARVFPEYESLTSGMSPDSVTSLDSFFMALITRLEKAPPLLLVLDDFHLINNAELLSGIKYFINHLPPHVRIIICSRTMPRIGAAALRVKRRLKEFNAEDLNFSITEAHRFFINNLPFAPSIQESTTITEQTEGWAVGLNVVALAASNRGELSNDGKRLSKQHIWEFFAEEVFDQQPQEIQAFLLATGILEEFDSELASLVAGIAHPQHIISQIRASNLFVQTIDDQSEWFRYHQLFAEFLQRRLIQCQPEMKVLFHSRAYAACMDRNLWIQAAQHALATKDVERISQVVRMQCWHLFYTAKPLMSACLDQLPDSIIHQSLDLTRIQAWLFIEQAQYQKVEPLLIFAESALKDVANNDQWRDMKGNFANIRAQLAEINEDYLTLKKQLKIADENLSHDARSRLAFANLAASLALHEGKTTAAETHYRDAITLAQKEQDYVAMLWSYSRLGGVLCLQGKLRDGRNIWELAVQEAERFDLYGEQNLLFILVGLTDLLLDQYELDRAQHYLAKAESMVANLRSQSSVPVNIVQLRYAIMEQNTKRARLAADTLEKLLATQKVNSYDVARAEEMLVFWWSKQANSAAIKRWLKQHDTVVASNESQSHSLVRAEALALVTTNQQDQAAVLLLHAAQIAEDQGYLLSLSKTLLILSFCFLQAERHDQAQACFARAVTIATTIGALGAFLMMSQQIEPLLKPMIDNMQTSSDVHFVKQLISYNNSNKSLKQGKHALPEVIRAIPLTVREWEILQAIGDGKKNEQIANESSTAISTVKSHIKSIYRKLNLNSRPQAVTRARELQSQIHHI